jgi:putative FmdB family regulatory protein
MVRARGGVEVPTYDYKCTKCGHTFSAEQSMLDKPLARCKKCRGKLEKMLPRSINLIFKGSGFYVTDYKKSCQRKGPKPAAGKDKDGESLSESAETKPEGAKA